MSETKTIIIACGSGIATSTIINSKVSELLTKNNIPFSIIQCSLNELDSYVDTADLVISSMNIYQELKVPKVMGMAYLTGIGEEETNKKILEILSK